MRKPRGRAGFCDRKTKFIPRLCLFVLQLFKLVHHCVGTVTRSAISSLRHASPLQDRDAGAPGTLDGFSAPEQFLGLFA
jgi:hypothetical protein